MSDNKNSAVAVLPFKKLNKNTASNRSVDPIDYPLHTTFVFEPSCTDASFFVPTSEAVKRLASAPAMSRDMINSAYDFPDGKDNGMSSPITRKPGADIAVVSQSIAERAKELDKRAADIIEVDNIQKTLKDLDAKRASRQDKQVSQSQPQQGSSE